MVPVLERVGYDVIFLALSCEVDVGGLGCFFLE